MATFQLEPKSEFLRKEYVLVQAWKKAHDYIRRHNWYADVLELDLTNADLESRLRAIGEELAAGDELQSQPLRLVLAPKAQQWEVKNNEWVPTNGPLSVTERLRPLAHLSVRDQIIGTAFMILLADVVETRQGDPRVPAMKARERRMVSYGHRLFCDAEDKQLRFRWGNAVVYRQYFQDYQAFVSRPQEVVDEVFGDKTDWAVVYADLSQFYDRVRPAALAARCRSPNSGRAACTVVLWRWIENRQADALTRGLESSQSVDQCVDDSLHKREKVAKALQAPRCAHSKELAHHERQVVSCDL